MEILRNCWLVLGEMGPYLLLGFAIAGMMSVLVSADWVSRHLGGRGMWPVAKATVLGVPLPLCSCGVIPVSAGLRRQGASRGATSAFLLATPQTGVDSILATYALLGPVLAVVRPVVALVSGLLGGWLVDRLGEKDEPNGASKNAAASEAKTSCAGSSCCGSHEDKVGGNKVVAAVRYGFVTLPRDIAVHLLVGVVIAGLLTGLIHPDIAAKWLGGGLLAMLAMMAIGLPLYVCATGSIPLAVAFIHLGASPGAAMVFLIAGPATNAATIGVTWKLLGKRSAMLYLLVTTVVALGAGFGIDYLRQAMPLYLPDVEHAHAAAIGWFNHVSAATLLAVLLGSFLFSRKARSGEKIVSDSEHQTVLNVLGMTCSHCAAAVAEALRSQPGVKSVDVDLAGKTAVVRGPVNDEAVLVAAVEQLGYSASVRGAG